MPKFTFEKSERKVDLKRVAAALGAVPVGAHSSKPLDIIDVREGLKRVIGPKPPICPAPKDPPRG
jgi:hypothetical protein